jgi:hypothetical protein
LRTFSSVVCPNAGMMLNIKNVNPKIELDIFFIFIPQSSISTSRFFYIIVEISKPPVIC